MKYSQRQRCRHVELEQLRQAFASRGFVSDSWAFLFLTYSNTIHLLFWNSAKFQQGHSQRTRTLNNKDAPKSHTFYVITFQNYFSRCFERFFTARCTLVQNAVLRSHVICLSDCLSVTLVNCDHIGWNFSKIISPLVSLGCSLFAIQTWRACSKGNTPKFGPKATHPLLIWALETFDRKLRPNGYR